MFLRQIACRAAPKPAGARSLLVAAGHAAQMAPRAAAPLLLQQLQPLAACSAAAAAAASPALQPPRSALVWRQQARGMAKKAKGKDKKAKSGAKDKKATRAEVAEEQAAAAAGGGKGGGGSAAAAAAADHGDGGDDDEEGGLLDVGKTQADMDRVLASLTRELKALRTGGADASMFDHVTVELYGAASPIAAVGQVKVTGASAVSISVFDPAAVEAVQVAVRDCGMGLNPQLDGTTLLVPVPKTTSESREATAKEAAKAAEGAKGASRGVRKRHMSKLKGDAVDGVSEDEVKRMQKQVQAIADATVKKIDELLKAKQEAIRNF
jgi:ribosome recycling factor